MPHKYNCVVVPTIAVIVQKYPGIKIILVGINPNRIAAWNDSNFENIPIYEWGLSDIVSKMVVEIF